MTKLYTELAEWWHVMSAPADYAEDAALYRDALEDLGGGKVETLLELGSGGGNNASHLKHHYHLTLVEPSDRMRARSEELNPECLHLPGDMRTVRLDKTFDAVFIHDAIGYMTTESDLRAAIKTAFLHCRPGSRREGTTGASGRCATCSGCTTRTRTTRASPRRSRSS